MYLWIFRKTSAFYSVLCWIFLSTFLYSVRRSTFKSLYLRWSVRWRLQGSTWWPLMHADARKRRVFAVRYGRARAKSITITLASGEALRYITLGIAVAVAHRTHAQSSSRRWLLQHSVVCINDVHFAMADYRNGCIINVAS